MQEAGFPTLREELEVPVELESNVARRCWLLVTLLMVRI